MTLGGLSAVETSQTFNNHEEPKVAVRYDKQAICRCGKPTFFRTCQARERHLFGSLLELRRAFPFCEPWDKMLTDEVARRDL